MLLQSPGNGDERAGSERDKPREASEISALARGSGQAGKWKYVSPSWKTRGFCSAQLLTASSRRGHPARGNQLHRDPRARTALGCSIVPLGPLTVRDWDTPAAGGQGWGAVSKGCSPPGHQPPVTVQPGSWLNVP